jgi:hypothetical protein
MPVATSRTSSFVAASVKPHRSAFGVEHLLGRTTSPSIVVRSNGAARPRDTKDCLHVGGTESGRWATVVGMPAQCSRGCASTGCRSKT